MSLSIVLRITCFAIKMKIRYMSKFYNSIYYSHLWYINSAITKSAIIMVCSKRIHCVFRFYFHKKCIETSAVSRKDNRKLITLNPHRKVASFDAYMNVIKHRIYIVNCKNILWIYNKGGQNNLRKIVFIKTFSSQLIDFCFYTLRRYDRWYRCLDKELDRRIVFDAKVVATVAHLKFIQKLIFNVLLY